MPIKSKYKRQPTPSSAYLSPELISETQHRLSRIEGHVRGVKCMLDERSECEQILIQLSAIRSALNQVTIKLFQGHMESCIYDCVVDGHGPQALERLEGALSQVLKKV